VQIVHSSRRGSRDIEHLGSEHTAAEVELLKAAGRQKLAAGQGELDLGLATGASGGPLPVISSVMGCLVDALAHAYDALGFPAATGRDEVFFQLVAARIIEPVSKLDSLRVLEEAGLVPVPYRTATRRLRVFARQAWRQQISAACAAHALYRFRTRRSYCDLRFGRMGTGYGKIAVCVPSPALPDHDPGLWRAGAAGPQRGVQGCGDHGSPS
jgi:hypothetical protein